MKTIEVRHGCHDAVKCGALDHHVCGSPDACTSVKASGFVCTFGTTTRTTFHEQTGIDAELASEVAQFEKVHGKADPVALAVLKHLVTKGKNLHTPEAEQDAKNQGHKHGTDNRVFHDANPHVFGH